MARVELLPPRAQAVRKSSGTLGAKPMFCVVDAVYSHIASEELLFSEHEELSALPEWAQHRVHHARARLRCFWLVTCNEADRGARLEHLQAVLCDHARDEMLLLSGLVRVLRTPHRVASTRSARTALRSGDF